MKKLFLHLIIGTLLSLVLITATDKNTFGKGFEPMIPYIGTAILGGILISNIRYHDDKINELENEINKLKKEIDKLKK